MEKITIGLHGLHLAIAKIIRNQLINDKFDVQREKSINSISKKTAELIFDKIKEFKIPTQTEIYIEKPDLVLLTVYGSAQGVYEKSKKNEITKDWAEKEFDGDLKEAVEHLEWQPIIINKEFRDI